MGECLKTRRGGVKYELPVLNSSYPKDVSLTVIEGNTTSATFYTEISTPGNPAKYTYQWYVDGAKVSGATSSSYTKTGLSSTATHKVYCEITNKAGTVTTRTATLSVVKYTKPVLNSSYPANVTQVEKSGGSATFKVSISTAGNPASYTYQWYVNGSAVSGATSSSYTKSGLTSAATYTVYCKVTNAAGTVQSRTATLTVKSSQPSYTYGGTHTLTKEGTYNWKLTLKTGGTLNFTNLGTGDGAVDIFCVGGGAGGNGYGGGGGYTTTAKNKSLAINTNYTITVGGGGSAGGGAGGQSSVKQSSTVIASADGGKSKSKDGGSGAGGNGGSGKAGNGGSDGGDGGYNYVHAWDENQGWYWYPYAGGKGQGTTTKEFGESNGTLYSGGGGGGANNGNQYNTGGWGGSGGGGNGSWTNIGTIKQPSAGGTNTGGGGGGAGDGYSNKAGGSGIVVIRNKR